MDHDFFMKKDTHIMHALVDHFCQYAKTVLVTQESRPASIQAMPEQASVPVNIDHGVGAEMAFSRLLEQFSDQFSGSAGPHFYGFVTGGSTPAGLIGDWLVSLFDQNVMGSNESIAPWVELEAIRMFIDLLGLETTFKGSFVTGATVSNFVGLSTAKQWYGKQFGVDIAKSGLFGVAPIKVLSGTAHSSIYKAMSMAGLGRDQLVLVDTLNKREAIDIIALTRALADIDGPCIVVANAGTVNTVDFDDLLAIGRLKKKYNFWLHVDAAFGGVAACSDSYKHLLQGVNCADSLTVDAHKWLNVPYDCAVQLTKHLEIQREVFMNAASYLSDSLEESNFVHLTPENSRRFRALPVWMSILAYGRRGFAEMVNRNVDCAKLFAQLVEQDQDFVLLSPVKLNGVCFTLSNRPGLPPLQARVKTLLCNIIADGRVFLTGTNYKGTPAIRLNVCNWQTTAEHIQHCYEVIKTLLR